MVGKHLLHGGPLHCGGHIWTPYTQVAQLGEQQVQGCTARITHLETDVQRQVAHLKQQHDDQAASLAGVNSLVEQLRSTHHSSSSEQLTAQLGQLDATVTDLQTAVNACTRGEASLQLKQDVDVLKDQMQQLRNSYASQQEAGSSVERLERDLASVKAAVCESNASKHLAESTTSGLQDDLAVLKEQLTELRSSHAEQASKTQQPILKLEHNISELSVTMLQLKNQAENHHVEAETFKALQHDMSGLKAEVAQLQSQPSAGEPHDELYSSLEHNVAATKDQLSSLRTQLTQHASQKPWQDESEKLRSELVACVKAASSTEAVVARHGTELSSIGSRLAELHSEASTGSQTHGQAQGGAQSEVEELNERLFELRVEVQNLADDTGISIASMTRKVRFLHHSSCVPECCCEPALTLTIAASRLQCFHSALQKMLFHT